MATNCRSRSYPLSAVIALWACLVNPVSAQVCSISGVVQDAVTSEGLMGVTVSTSPGRGTCTTDSRGMFMLSVPPGHCTLQLDRIGYKTRTVDTTAVQGITLHLVISLVGVSVLIEEVTVVAERSPLMPLPGLAGTAVSPVQTEHIGGAFSDALRAIQALPGVTSNNEMSSQFSVRGGGVSENLILLGGTQMLEPFHVKESPNTSLSVVNLSLLRSMTFIPGGFTARYGDRLSSVLDMEYRQGNRERLAGQLEASLTDGAITLEGPLSAAGSGVMSLRTTYSDYISNYLPDGDYRAPAFFDIQGTAGFAAGENHHITAQFLVGRDRTSGIANGEYGVTLVSIGSRHMLSQESMLRTSLSYYRQYEDLSRAPYTPALSGSTIGLDDKITLGEAKLFLEGKIAPWYSLNTGVELQGHDYEQDHKFQPTNVAEQPIHQGSQLSERSYRAGLYAENIFQATPELLINAGMRADHISLTRETKVSPRLLAAYHIPNGPTLRGSWGVYYQSATHDELLAAAGAGLSPQRMQKAIHYVFGLHHQLRSDVAFHIELYRKDIRNLISFVRLRSGEIVHSPRNDSEGKIDGIEMEFTLKDERVMAWVNLALMEAREINLYNGGGWHFMPTDQQKTVTAVFEYRVAHQWTANVRAFYGSGYAYGADLPGVDDTRLHYPNYVRVDARINFQFPLAGMDCLSFLEIMNLFNFRNVSSFATTAEKVAEPDFNLLLPRVVNVGLKVKF